MMTFHLLHYIYITRKGHEKSRRLIEGPASASSGENSSKSRQQMGIEVLRPKSYREVDMLL